MILVYTHSVTPRIRYIFKTIFTQFIGVEVSLTSQVEEFISFTGTKFSYTKNPLGSELFFSSHSILFEKGIIDHKINVISYQGQKVFLSKLRTLHFLLMFLLQVFIYLVDTKSIYLI